jgi:ATP-dependent DNA ligase
MVARPVAELPNEKHVEGFTFEPKLDGRRCLAFYGGGDVEMMRRMPGFTTTRTC